MECKNCIHCKCKFGNIYYCDNIKVRKFDYINSHNSYPELHNSAEIFADCEAEDTYQPLDSADIYLRIKPDFGCINFKQK